MILFQDLVDETQVGEVISEEKTLSVIDLIVSGGAGSILIISLLFAMLAVAMYIYFERLLAIKAASSIDKNFMNQIRDHVMNGKLEAAKILCAQTNSPVARLTEKGISRIRGCEKIQRTHREGRSRAIQAFFRKYHTFFCQRG